MYTESSLSHLIFFPLNTGCLYCIPHPSKEKKMYWIFTETSMFYRVWAPYTVVTDSLFGKVPISSTDILVYIAMKKQTILGLT